LKVIAIIPARKGSKGVPGKNKMLFNGRPLIEYSIEIALKTNQIDEIVVTTDDEEILLLSKNYPIILHKRTISLSSDSAKIVDVIEKVLETLDLDGELLVVLLQPTSPLRTSNELDSSITLMKRYQQYQSLISVVEVGDQHPARMYRVDEHGTMEAFLPELEEIRRQDLPKIYLRNGAIYIFRHKVGSRAQVMKKPSYAFVMDPEKNLNIDTPLDCIMAPYLLEKYYE
jgi:CMP-N,N'-diacetyllegionaminic acid synthase